MNKMDGGKITKNSCKNLNYNKLYILININTCLTNCKSIPYSVFKMSNSDVTPVLLQYFSNITVLLPLTNSTLSARLVIKLRVNSLETGVGLL